MRTPGRGQPTVVSPQPGGPWAQHDHPQIATKSSSQKSPDQFVDAQTAVLRRLNAVEVGTTAGGHVGPPDSYCNRSWYSERGRNSRSRVAVDVGGNVQVSHRTTIHRDQEACHGGQLRDALAVRLPQTTKVYTVSCPLGHGTSQPRSTHSTRPALAKALERPVPLSISERGMCCQNRNRCLET